MPNRSQKPLRKIAALHHKVRSSGKAGVLLVQRWMGFFLEKPLYGYIALTVLLMLATFLMEGLSGYFKASILESKVPTFDGTVMPVEKVPNWVKTGGKNDQLYSSYNSKDLIPIMPYNPKQLENEDSESDADINARITYSVVYLGNYQFEHKENVGSHLAVDIRVPEGTPVYAVANSVVFKAIEQNSGFGYHVVLKIPKAPVNGKEEALYVAYAHLSKVEVEEGEIVKKGQKIGESGETGTATTPHVHFQIDRDTAPWHPWWPFSSTEASAVGLSFFEAINAGLGLQVAKENTVNPLIWVQSNLKGKAPVAKEEDTPQASNSGNLDSFEITSSVDEIVAGDRVYFTITAYNEDNEIFAGFDERFQFECSDDDIDIPNVNFNDGVAEFSVQMPNSGRVKCTIATSDVDASKRITVTEDEEGSLHAAADESGTAFDHFDIAADSEILIPGMHTTLTITAQNTNDQTVTDFRPSESITLTANNGELGDDTLTRNDFENGVATVRFTAGASGAAEVRIADARLVFTIVEGLNPVASFALETERSFIPNVPQLLTITTRDHEGNTTPASFIGTASFTFLQGSGTLEPSELSANDFHDGKAVVQLKITSGDRVVLKLKSGVLVGETDRLSADEKMVFHDVRKGSEYAEAIEYLKDNKVINGYPDGTFRPDATINRVETAKILLEAMKIRIERGQSSLKDVPSDAWFSNYVFTAEKRSIINGYPDKTFRPANTINRAEFFKVMLEADDVSLQSTVDDSEFSDVSADAWFAKYAAYAKDNNLLDFGKWFAPEKEVSRGEFAEALYRLLI